MFAAIIVFLLINSSNLASRTDDKLAVKDEKISSLETDIEQAQKTIEEKELKIGQLERN